MHLVNAPFFSPSLPPSLPIQHIDKVVKHKDLQQQLVDAKLHQAHELLKQSEERHDREKDFVRLEHAHIDTHALHARIYTLTHTC